MVPCLHFGLRLASGRFTIEPKLASWVESGYKSPESAGPRQRGRRRDGLSRRRRGRFRSTAPYPAATNSRGVSKPRARRDNRLRARKSISVTNEVRVELYHQAQYNQCVTIIDLRALTFNDLKGSFRARDLRNAHHRHISSSRSPSLMMNRWVVASTASSRTPERRDVFHRRRLNSVQH